MRESAASNWDWSGRVASKRSGKSKTTNMRQGFFPSTGLTFGGGTTSGRSRRVLLLTGSVWKCDVVCGGFPCQDISYAGKGAGLLGERSGLWFEFARVVGEVCPRIVLVENVAALLSRGIGEVLGTLASFGYDAEWHCIPAAAVGAPHLRERVFIVAHSRHAEPSGRRQSEEGKQEVDRERGKSWDESSSCGVPVSDTNGERLEGPKFREQRVGELPGFGDLSCKDRWDGWGTEPDVGRVADGVPARVDRLRCLGNAVVPQVAQWIGERVLESLS